MLVTGVNLESEAEVMKGLEPPCRISMPRREECSGGVVRFGSNGVFWRPDGEPPSPAAIDHVSGRWVDNTKENCSRKHPGG